MLWYKDAALSDESVEGYKEHGYILVRNGYSGSAIRSTVDELDRYLTSERTWRGCPLDISMLLFLCWQISLK